MSAAATAVHRDALAAGLFPPAVLAVSAPIDSDTGALLPEERALVARAVPKRQREFATGRRCAHALLAALGHPHAPLLRDEHRAPRWPAGVVGSISHCDTLCVVAVADARDVAGIGIDVEPDLPLEAPLWSKICTPGERDTLLARAPAAERGRIARWIFSAKEATYKSVHPRIGLFLGFQEVELHFEAVAPGGCRFAARLPIHAQERLPSGARVEGRVEARAGYTLSGAVLIAPCASTEESA